MEGKVMINSDVPYTESIKHWGILVILPLLWEGLGILSETKTFFFPQKTRTATTPGGFWGTCVLVSSRYSVDGDAQTWGHHISQCLFPSSRIHDRGPEAPGSRMFLSEQSSWTMAHFLHRSECLQEEQAALNCSHGGNSSSSLSLTHISDPAGREPWVHLHSSAGHTTCIYDCVREARLLHITFSRQEGVFAVPQRSPARWIQELAQKQQECRREWVTIQSITPMYKISSCPHWTLLGEKLTRETYWTSHSPVPHNEVWHRTCWQCFLQLKRLLGLMHNFFWR